MKGEMDCRHSREDDEQRSNIKECHGGLRDMEMLLLMYATKHRIRECLSRRFLRRLSEMEPELADDFMFLDDHLTFIKNLRDVYRLKVAAHNVIAPEYLIPVTVSMGYEETAKGSRLLYDDFLKRTEIAAKVVDKLAGGVK